MCTIHFIPLTRTYNIAYNALYWQHMASEALRNKLRTGLIPGVDADFWCTCTCNIFLLVVDFILINNAFLLYFQYFKIFVIKNYVSREILCFLFSSRILWIFSVFPYRGKLGTLLWTHLCLQITHSTNSAFLTRSLREPGGPCTKSMEVSEFRMERVNLVAQSRFELVSFQKLERNFAHYSDCWCAWDCWDNHILA